MKRTVTSTPEQASSPTPADKPKRTRKPKEPVGVPINYVNLIQAMLEEQAATLKEQYQRRSFSGRMSRFFTAVKSYTPSPMLLINIILLVILAGMIMERRGIDVTPPTPIVKPVVNKLAMTEREATLVKAAIVLVATDMEQNGLSGDDAIKDALHSTTPTAVHSKIDTYLGTDITLEKLQKLTAAIIVQ